MDLIRAINDLGICFAIFRNSDLRLVYGNQLAVNTFGIADYETQVINVWELLDPRSVGVGIVTK